VLVPWNDSVTRPIRVAFLTRSMEVGGAEVQLSLLARNLGSEDFDVRVFTLYSRGLLAKTLEDAGVTLVSVEKRGRWDLVGPYRRLVRRLREYQPDILHSFLAPPNIFAALVKPSQLGCRLVWGFRASNMDLDRYDWSHRASETLQRRLVRRVDKIVTNSQSGRDFAVSRGFSSDQQVVIPNGIDTEKFVPDPSSVQSLRKKWGVADDAHVVGIAARLDPMKDHGTFLRAAAIAAKQSPSLHFVCVGDGQAAYRDALHSQASQLGLNHRLTWAGHHQNMAQVYNALDVATLTSAFGEGFPNAVGEAMACGTPCVVTDVGDGVDIVGDASLHAPVGDENALARGWMKLIAEDPEDKVDRATACRTRIVENFSMGAMVGAHQHLYQSLAHSSVNH